MVDTKHKIIETATEQFKRFGVRSVTMDDIARQTGVSKKTIYQEFADKNQLVYETFQAALLQDSQMLEDLPRVKNGVIEHLIGLFNHMKNRFGELNPFVLNEIERYYPQCWQLFEDFKQEHILKKTMEVMEMGKEEGYFRLEINAHITAKLRVEQMMISFDPIKFPPSKYNMVDLQLEIFEQFLYGIFTEKGREAYLKQKTSQA